MRFAVLILCLGGAMQCAAAVTTEPTGAAPRPQMATPKGSLHYSDVCVREGGAAKALDFYYWTNEQEKKVAEAMARTDAAASDLEKVVRAHYSDKETITMLLHAMLDETDEDIDDAKETITGDTAVIEWKDGHSPLTMVRVGGEWKVSIPEIAKDFSADNTAEQFVKFNETLAAEFGHLAGDINSGKYVNAPLLERAIKRDIDRVVGGE